MKLGYTLFYVDDVLAALTFYELAFGLKRKFVHESGYGELDTGATTLGFVAHALATSNGVPYAKTDVHGLAPAVEIGLVTDDVAAAYDKAVKAGAAPVVAPKVKPWGQTVAYVRDRHGFLVELCTPAAP